jgi:hypothetical protein
MGLTRSSIEENDYVVLTIEVGKWPAGTRGTAVFDHGEVKLVQVLDDRGQELDMFIVPNENLKLVARHH